MQYCFNEKGGSFRIDLYPDFNELPCQSKYVNHANFDEVI